MARVLHQHPKLERGPGQNSADRVWSRLRRGMTHEINAISTILSFFLAAILHWFHLGTRTQQTGSFHFQQGLTHDTDSARFHQVCGSGRGDHRMPGNLELQHRVRRNPRPWTAKRTPFAIRSETCLRSTCLSSLPATIWSSLEAA